MNENGNQMVMPVAPFYGGGGDSMGRYTSRMEQPDPMGGEYGYPFPRNSGTYYGPRW